MWIVAILLYIYINLNYIMVWLGLDVIYRPQKYIKEKDRYTIKYKHNNNNTHTYITYVIILIINLRCSLAESQRASFKIDCLLYIIYKK